MLFRNAIFSIFSLILWIFTIPAQANEKNREQSNQQCFLDPKSAYEYLLQKEVQNKQDQTAKIKRVSINNAININTATEAELVTLKGIGSKRAQDILLYRETIGKFHSIDELTHIKGIGAKTLAKNREKLRVE